MKRLCLKNKLFLENISLENLSIFPIIIKVAYSGICGTDLQILKKNYNIILINKNYKYDCNFF
jgi:threonine dehydrogenase-like Zn-dependent dehydrogenase